MSEDINLQTLKGRSSVFTTTKTPELIGEGAEHKEKLRLRSGSHEIYLIKRRIDSEELVPIMLGFDKNELGKTLSEKYIIALNILRKRNLPVVDTARIISDNEVAVTDETANGGVVFDIKSETLKMVYPDTYGHRNTKYDRLFLNIDTNELTERIKNISTLASKNGIELSLDSTFHIIINNDGTWKIKILDIAFTKIWKDPSKTDSDPIYNYPNRSLKRSNEIIADNWISSFDFFRLNIKNPRSG